MSNIHERSRERFRQRLAEQEKAMREGFEKALGEEQQEPPVVHTIEPDPQPEPQAQPEPQPEPENVAPEPQPEPAPQPAQDARENDPNYWRHRHATTEGILRAEKEKAKQLAEEAAALRAEADRLRKETVDKQRKADAESRVRSLEQIDLSEFFTPAEIEEYGEKHLRTVLKGNVKAALKTIDPSLQAEMEQMRAEVASVRDIASQSREQAFWSRLDSSAKDWRAKQANPDFLSWLAEVDPVSGRTRDSYVKDAQKALDAERVAAIFNAYTLHSSVAPQPTAPQRPSAPPAGKPTTAAPPPPPQKLRHADYIAFQDEVSKGKWKGRDKEAAEVDRKFIRALQEGNLV